MAGLAIFGWLVLCGLAAYACVGGLVMAWCEAAFAGRSGPFSWIAIGIGGLLVVAAIVLCPFTVGLKP